METDKTTLADLSIFNNEEEFSFFNKLNLCNTSRGRDQLYANFCTPLKTIGEIKGVQQTIQYMLQRQQFWPAQISNGTIMVIEKFYESPIDEIPSGLSSFSAFTYKLLHSYDFSLVKYSAQHCFDFIKGMQLMIKNFLNDASPAPLKKILEEAKHIISKEQLSIVEKHDRSIELKVPELLHFAGFIRYHYKLGMLGLLDIYARLDAWLGMAKAVNSYGLQFPEFIETTKPLLQVKGLYHLLLTKAVSYDVDLSEKNNFLFLTGANMAGKSTFIKSVGSAVFLAHTGMGVPAQQMQLSFFDGLLSNINVADNIARGESYFYNEVQRIKATVTKINDGKKWLILIDELFKGTNVQDAMKCSSTVIEGLLKIKNSLFILSTHLYEIGEDLKQYSNINFKYFETSVTGDQLQFSYRLKDGISNDRLGYLIMKREGVIDLLGKL
jgi:DNA mismatch repair ATPase MutS